MNRIGLFAGLIKVCLSYENGLLPGNLHYKQPNPNNESLKTGILKVYSLSSTSPWYTLQSCSDEAEAEALGILHSQLPLHCKAAPGPYAAQDFMEERMRQAHSALSR